MQTRCGTGTKGLTKREKSTLYYEIELSKPWRSFCDRSVEVELENILKETFGGKLGYGLNHRLSVLGNEYKGYKIDLSLNLYADDVETMSSLVDLAFVGNASLATRMVCLYRHTSERCEVHAVERKILPNLPLVGIT